MRDLGFDAVVSLSLTDPGMPGRLRIPDGDLRAEPIRVSNPLSAEHSVERTALLGSLLDAAGYNRAHGAERVALYRVRPRVPARGQLIPRWRPGRRSSSVSGPTPAFEPWRIAALATGALRPRRLARGSGGGGLLLAQGHRSRRWPRSSARRSRSFRARSRSFTRAAAAGCCVGGRRRRLDRRDPSAGLPRLGSGGRRGLRDRSGAAGGRLSGRRRELRGRDLLSRRPSGRRGRRR